MGIGDNATRIIFFKTHNKRLLKILRDEFLGYIIDNSSEIRLLGELNTNIYIDIELNKKPPSYR